MGLIIAHELYANIAKQSNCIVVCCPVEFDCGDGRAWGVSAKFKTTLSQCKILIFRRAESGQANCRMEGWVLRRALDCTQCNADKRGKTRSNYFFCFAVFFLLFLIVVC